MSYRDNTREAVQAPKFPRSDEEVNAILDKRRAEYNERQPPKGWPRYIDPQLPDSALRRALFWRRGTSILVMSVVLLAFVLWFLATMASALSLAIVGELYRFYPKWLHSILSFKTAIDLNVLGWRWCLWPFTNLVYVIPVLLGASSVIVGFLRLRPYFKRERARAEWKRQGGWPLKEFEQPHSQKKIRYEPMHTLFEALYRLCKDSSISVWCFMGTVEQQLGEHKRQLLERVQSATRTNEDAESGIESVHRLHNAMLELIKRDHEWRGSQSDRDRLDTLDRSIVETEFERLYNLLSGNDRTGVRIAPEEATPETWNDAEVEVEARRPNEMSVAIPI